MHELDKVIQIGRDHPVPDPRVATCSLGPCLSGTIESYFFNAPVP